MRTSLLAGAAILAIAAVPAFAQTASQIEHGQPGTPAITEPTDQPGQPTPVQTNPDTETGAQIQHGTSGATEIVAPNEQEYNAQTQAATVPAINQPAPRPVVPAAQASATVPMPTTSRDDGYPGGHEPYSVVASNIVPADTRSDIAPRLPTPPLGDNASPADFLRDARRSISMKHTGQAQEALERAETRVLDMSSGQAPGQSDAVRSIARARDALGRNDLHAADMAIGDAMKALPGASA
jgi:hypothetical protein